MQNHDLGRDGVRSTPSRPIMTQASVSSKFMTLVSVLKIDPKSWHRPRCHPNSWLWSQCLENRSKIMTCWHAWRAALFYKSKVHLLAPQLDVIGTCLFSEIPCAVASKFVVWWSCLPLGRARRSPSSQFYQLHRLSTVLGPHRHREPSRWQFDFQMHGLKKYFIQKTFMSY